MVEDVLFTVIPARSKEAAGHRTTYGKVLPEHLGKIGKLWTAL